MLLDASYIITATISIIITKTIGSFTFYDYLIRRNQIQCKVYFCQNQKKKIESENQAWPISYKNGYQSCRLNFLNYMW